MGKVFGIVGMVASAFVGNWVYAEYKASNCQASVDNFRDAYRKQIGNPNRSDIAKMLKKASAHCAAGQYGEAYRLLDQRVSMCRMGGDC
ncbi:MAG: hypothetical protein GC190_10815 [Alphaproteobacteria bacterium]|nr:hypothetical protein [Alphaproteobacteria bacterium]